MTLSSLRSNSLMPLSVFPAANFSNTPTGTFTDSNGFSWQYVTFNTSGSLTVTAAGYLDILVMGGGGGSDGNGAGWGGSGAGGLYFGMFYVPAGTYTVVVGGGGSSGAGKTTGGNGSASSFGGTFLQAGGGYGGHVQGPNSYGGQSGGGNNQNGGSGPYNLNYTGTVTTYGANNRGVDGGNPGLPGIVIVKRRTN